MFVNRKYSIPNNFYRKNKFFIHPQLKIIRLNISEKQKWKQEQI